MTYRSRPTYQIDVEQFVARHGLDTDPATRVLDLTSEAGELAKELLKSTDYGRTPFEPGAGWREELGDLFFSLICLANQSDVDLDEALRQVLGKYEARLAHSQDAGSGR